MEKVKAFWASLPIRKKILLAVAVLILIGIATQGKAQQNCGPVENIFASLSSQYGERPVAMGLSSQVQIQVWANESTGTWSIVVVSPNGGACLVAEGENYETIAPEPNV